LSLFVFGETYFPAKRRAKMSNSIELYSNEIENRIFTIRGLQVMIDSDLALMYGVETKRLNEQVKRNQDRFPDDFMFQITESEWEILRSQNATLRKCL